MKKAIIISAICMAILVISLPICFASEISLVYDANGNLISGDGYNRTYNSLNQLNKVYNETGTLLQEYKYHPVEERVHVKVTYNEDGTNETVIYISNTFVRIINSSGSYDYTYIYQDGVLVGQINPDGSKIYIHPDHLGSSTVITNQQGEVVENTSYSPFGEVLSGGTETRYGYEGKEYDTVLGDIDFNARRYDPSRGQFLQPDTIIQNLYDPQTLNRYAFERNNPYKYVDEDGHWAQVIVGGAIVVGLFALRAGISEYSIQRMYAGEVYSWGKIFKSAAKSAGAGTAIVSSLMVPVAGPYLSAALFYGYSVYSDTETIKSIEEAQQYKIEAEKAQEETIAPIIPSSQMNTLNQANAQSEITTYKTGQNTPPKGWSLSSRLEWYKKHKMGTSKSVDPEAFYERLRQARERASKS